MMCLLINSEYNKWKINRVWKSYKEVYEQLRDIKVWGENVHIYAIRIARIVIPSAN
jgi:hypothetical protein